MTIDQLITAMVERRAKLVHNGSGKLATRGSKRALTPDLLAAIREHKRELLRRMAEIERRYGTDGPGPLDLLAVEREGSVAA